MRLVRADHITTSQGWGRILCFPRKETVSAVVGLNGLKNELRDAFLSRTRHLLRYYLSDPRWFIRRYTKQGYRRKWEFLVLHAAQTEKICSYSGWYINTQQVKLWCIFEHQWCKHRVQLQLVLQNPIRPSSATTWCGMLWWRRVQSEQNTNTEIKVSNCTSPLCVSVLSWHSAFALF